MPIYQTRFKSDVLKWEDTPVSYCLRSPSMGEYLYMLFGFCGGMKPKAKETEIRVNEMGSLQGHYFNLVNGYPTNVPEEYTALADLNSYLEEWELQPELTIKDAWLAVSKDMDTTCYCHEGLERNGSMCCLCLWRKYVN